MDVRANRPTALRDESVLGMNARLMRRTLLEIAKKHMENWDWVVEKP